MGKIIKRHMSEFNIMERGKKMTVLEDGVYSSISFYGRSMFSFDRISYEHKKLLKSIKPRQRKKFKNMKLVPWQLLQVLWDLDFLPTEKRPQEGMRISELLKLLRKGQYRDDKQRSRGVLLHDTIDQEEFRSEANETYEILVECGRGKFVPVSYLRKIPGTIFK
jgi:hypothetical protein